ncbi:hypothetical protein FAZ21_02925 [Chitiniphilus eburneus]|uniref:DUF7079 domain-containing protein n=1 Tax=Chitiniphilus eburneus TaxID=2571148 RepID=A0A4U0QMK2_9NEIS|nr:hypothetical protein [Chitiniphilus eburneus]TJZ77314.1 hypothetical protein FAZ21_02925 [Chitiniphilus eburneus]
MDADRQARIWAALSDIFIDNEVDFGWIARQVADVPLATLEHAFFEEVAPLVRPQPDDTHPSRLVGIRHRSTGRRDCSLSGPARALPHGKVAPSRLRDLATLVFQG